MRIDSIGFFDSLATEMNAHPDRYRVVGEADMVAVIVMRRADGDFRVRIDFEELRCSGVAAADADELADFGIVGPLDAWQAMFDDVVANGRATGLQTINSLVLLGDRIALAGSDPMGLDKFSRFNQTLQEFFDGAARLAPAAVAG